MQLFTFLLFLRWGILWKPLRCPLQRMPLVIGVCMKLHNLIIDQTDGHGYSCSDYDEVLEYDSVKIGAGRRYFKRVYRPPKLNKKGSPVAHLEVVGNSRRGEITSSVRRDKFTHDVYHVEGLRRRN